MSKVAPHRQLNLSLSGPAWPNGDGGDPLATERQVNYLNDLASKAGWKLTACEKHVKSLYDLDDLSQLTKQMASDLITQLQNSEHAPPH